MKERAVEWVHRAEERNAYRISVGEPDGSRLAERRECKYEKSSIIKKLHTMK
jgi:hypothetical protein